MKKVVVSAAVVLLSVIFVSSVFAAARAGGQAHKNTGCGLGTMIFQDRAEDSSLLQAFQATTNGSFGAQTFGITTGTSECDQPSRFVKNDELNAFVLANMDNLAKDIAQGQGETLEAFAELLQVPNENRPGFYGKLRTNFANIFTSEHVVLAAVVDNIGTISSR